jgi:carboxyl-terminal processing protease
MTRRWIYSFAFAAILLAFLACQTDTSPAAAPEAETQEEMAKESEVESFESDDALHSDPMILPTAIPLVDPPDVPQGVPEELATAWEVWSMITEQHVDRRDLEAEKFDEGAIQGIIAALGDRHTSYVPPEAFQIENQDLYGSFEGIGATVQMHRSGLVVSPMEGSPAEQAGLRPGDIVVAVNGESIIGLSLLEAVNRIRGPRGTEVRLLVKHLGEAGEVEIVVIRDRIPLESVRLRSRPEDRFAHIRLTTFFKDTPQKLADAIESAQAEGAEGLILDVRDNPGGLLSSVVEVTSMFMEDGLIMYQVDGSGNRIDHQTENPGTFADIPLVILANQFSASGSEIVVGALQDHGRAPVVGATTFGKGSVGSLRRLSNGGGLYLTIGKWYTPIGRLIHGNGIDPDFEVTSRDKQKADTSQFEKAVEVMEDLLDGRQTDGA